MSRSYGAVRPKKNLVYAVEDVLTLYDITRNTLTNWIKAGLRPVDDQRPQVFRGAELIRFHAERAFSNRRHLRAGEFKCTRCKSRVVPDIDTVGIDAGHKGRFLARGRCPDCGGQVVRLLDAPTCTAYKSCIETSTSLCTLHEEEELPRAGIGINAQVPCSEPVVWSAENERIIHAYQAYCGKYAVQTRDAHLAAIRAFECHFGLKSFRKVKPDDADRFRQELARRGREDASRSTIRHQASQLALFFKWLVEQDGYRQMNRSIPDYFELSRESAAKALQPADRPVPTMDMLLEVITAMPTQSLMQRRDRAIIAITCLFGTRANATASLHLGDLDEDLSKLRQDATRMRIKNSKSQVTVRFTVDEAFRAPLRVWGDEMRALGLRGDDALFPPDKALENSRQFRLEARAPVAPWSTEEGVRRAFQRGCEAAGVDYINPHAVRHALAALGRSVCRSLTEEQAWSHNLGHADIQVTRSHYAKMTDVQRDKVFAALGNRDQTPEDDKELLLRYHEHLLLPGTPEFERAERLYEKRRKARARSGRDD